MTQNCAGRAKQTCNGTVILENSTADQISDDGFHNVTDEHDGTCLFAQHTQSICCTQVAAAMLTQVNFPEFAYHMGRFDAADAVADH